MNKFILRTLLLGLSLVSAAASASVITFYSDRATWLADAIAAGLTVTVEDFSTEPLAYPDITVGGIDWTFARVSPTTRQINGLGIHLVVAGP